MESKSIQKPYIIVGDIGGTNCRLQLLRLSTSDPSVTPDIVYNLTFDTQKSPSFADTLIQFIDDSKIDKDLIQCAVLGMAGPVFNGNIEFQTNIKHWCPLREKEIEKKAGLPRLVLLNDFVANGYGMIKLKEEEVFKIYEPEEGVLEDKVRLVFGVGTGCGVCALIRPEENSNFAVYPSEGGFIKMMTYNEIDRKFEDFVANDKKNERVDIQMFLSGLGFKLICEFLYKKSGNTYDSKLIADKGDDFENISSRVIGEYAKNHNDQLCIDTSLFFLDYLAHYLIDITFTFLPSGGIYLTSTVIQSMEYLFEQPEIRKRFTDIFQDRKGMASYLKRVPLTLVKIDDLATRGCITYALQNNLITFD